MLLRRYRGIEWRERLDWATKEGRRLRLWTMELFMFENFFRQRAKAGEPKRAKIESGQRIYCVGDVHGRADLLHEVIDFIAKDVEHAPGRTQTIFLGDFVDRGPDSAGVLERLSAGEFPTEFTALLGNHDRMLLDFIERAAALETWRRYGALETRRSYDVPLAAVIRGTEYAEAQAALRACRRRSESAHIRRRAESWHKLCRRSLGSEEAGR